MAPVGISGSIHALHRTTELHSGMFYVMNEKVDLIENSYCANVYPSLNSDYVILYTQRDQIGLSNSWHASETDTGTYLNHSDLQYLHKDPRGFVAALVTKDQTIDILALGQIYTVETSFSVLPLKADI